MDINSWHFKMLPPEERIMLRSEWQGPCLVYTGQRSLDGYGLIRHERKHEMVHRLMWEILVGPIPPGKELDHLCRNEPCWWTDHLRIVTPMENLLASYNPAAMNARKTHCKRGHAFTDDNTYWYSHQGRRKRRCRTCHTARMETVIEPDQF